MPNETNEDLGFVLVKEWRSNKWGWAGLVVILILNAGPQMLESIPADAGVVSSVVAGAIVIAGFLGRALVMAGALRRGE